MRTIRRLQEGNNTEAEWKITIDNVEDSPRDKVQCAGLGKIDSEHDVEEIALDIRELTRIERA